MLISDSSEKKSAWTPTECDPTTLFGEEKVLTSSQAQREIFSASLTDPDASRSYNHSISIFFEGALDLDAIYSCLLNLLKRHEALRGTFSADGELFRVRDGLAFSLPVTDFEGRAEADLKNDYDKFVRRELDHVFDLVNGPLFRSSLIRYSATRWTLIFNCHHIVVDGWSLKTIMDDLPKLYSALVAGLDEANVAPPSSFIEYLKTAVDREKETSDSVRKFWKQTFEDGVPVLDLPLDKARPVYRTYESRREDYKIDRRIYEGLKQEGAKNGASQFVSLLSAFSLYLYRISGQEDHIVGVPAAGQIKSGKAKLLGHDARLLPVRCTVQPNDTFKTFSKRVMERFFAAYENQWISLPGLIQELQLPQDPSRVPFVSVMFNFDPGMKAEDFTFQGLKSSHYFNHRNFETFELSINAVVENGDMILECAYNSALFTADEMHQRLSQLETLMGSIAANPDLPVAQLRILDDRQLQEMDVALNSTAMKFERELCVDQLIEQIVQTMPKSVAVEFQDSTLDYSAVWEASGKIAAAILARGLGPKPLVGVMIERTEAMVPVLLGVWRAGGAFVPLDPSYPTDRLQYMVEHSGIRLVLAQSSLFGTLQIDNIEYQDVAKILSSQIAPLAGTVSGRSSDDIAYVIYTSGSTGLPKGVKVPQRALNNFLCTMKTQAPGITADDRVLAVTTLSFDIAELELWLPLVSGARVVIVDRATAIDGLALIKTIEEKKISFIQATPATWRLLVFSGWEGNRKITGLCGGEALPRELADDILERVGILWNVYGPTETTVWSTLDRVRQGPITIGRPIGNTQAYVLDAQGAWVPRGVVGELWLGGDGVTDGYLGRDDLTRERFVANNFTGKGQIYKTGDLVRLRPDGRIEYVGRNDFQVKVRGFRIELGEVQHALAKHPAVQQCIVVVKEKAPGDGYLVAYYSLKPGQTCKASDLKLSMKGLIPDYMLPSHFIELAEMPLTNNGKINVKALPSAFSTESPPDEDFIPPRSPEEIYLARLWTELLGVNRVGRKDRFLELGGHSLLAIKTIQRVEKERGIRLTPKSMILKSLDAIAAEMGGEAPSGDDRPAPPARATVEIPSFFGNPNKKKFGYYYQGSKSAEFAVLVCPPLGQEYMRTHWLIRNISSSLNRKGLPVLRFDYFGQGDSYGNPEDVRLADLCDSVIQAADELRERSGVRKIKLVAFRASSLIAELVQERLGSGTEILLIDPVTSGMEYLYGLRKVQENRWKVNAFSKTCFKDLQHEELLGSLYSHEWLLELRNLKMTAELPTVNPESYASAGWDDFRRLEQIWLSPDLIREIQQSILGEAP